jgi:hypothetical protein
MHGIEKTYGQNLRGKPEGRKPPATPTHRLSDNIKVDL